MRKTGKAKTLLTMLLAAAALQAGTAFGAQATGESQLQAGTWVKEAEGWKFRKPSGEMATGWIQTASGWYYLQPENGLMETGMLRMNDRNIYPLIHAIYYVDTVEIVEIEKQYKQECV